MKEAKFRNTLFYIVFNSVLFLLPVTMHAKEPARVVAGWLESVRIEQQKFKVKAKLDTGAKTSSINAKNIQPFEKNGAAWVKFTLVLTDNKDQKHTLNLEYPSTRNTVVKNHDGQHDNRYVVNLDICFNGDTFNTEFTLADRTEYLYDILLGREFLKQIVIIDPRQIFLTTPNCG